MYLTLKEWAELTSGEILCGSFGVHVGGYRPGGLSFDSRTISTGDWFIALKGKTGRDGHEFLSQAINKGAEGAIMSDRDMYEINMGLSCPDHPALVVDDTTEAMGKVAAGLIRKFNPLTIAVTGTVGKTTVKENIAYITSTKWPTLRNRHNWNTEIGLPMTIFDLEQDHKAVVLECASRGAGQISYLSRIAQPEIAVITAIGPGHLSEFGTVDDVARAKWEITESLDSNGVVIAPGECRYTALYSGDLKLVTFGLGESNDFHPEDIDYGNEFTRFVLVTPEGKFETQIPGTSRADLVNAVCAAAVVMQIGHGHGRNHEIDYEPFTLNQIANALNSLPSTSGRLETIIRDSGVEVIFDAYNSNPLSLDNALDLLATRASLQDGKNIIRRVAILGDMLELGENEAEFHRNAGARIGSLPVDVLITVGELSGHIADEAKKTGSSKIEGAHFDTTDMCADALPGLLREGDLVLIKASRGFEFEKLLEVDW